jgi:hypothetical protein
VEHEQGNVITLGLRDRRDKEKRIERKNGTDRITLIFIEIGRSSLTLLTSNVDFYICKYHNGKLAN